MGCVAVGFALYPSAPSTYWGHRLFLKARDVGRVENASNQSIRGILARLLRNVVVPDWWLAIAAVVFVLGVAAAVRLSCVDRPVWSLTAMAITASCVSPISWSHHWVWCSLMLLCCIDGARLKRQWPWVAAGATIMAPFILALVFWAPSTDHREPNDTHLQELLSATYVLAGIALVGTLTAASADDPTRRKMNSETMSS